MSIQVFNTLTRKKEPLVPMEEGKIKIYTCGPTIHDFAHIGNFRTFVASDLVRRYLRYRGLEVFQVMNITDVEDKIIRKSQESGKPMRDYTKEYEDAFYDDLKCLNIEQAEARPRATDPEVMDKMAEMIEDLMDKGIAYKSSDGSIYYNIAKFPGYGELANIKVEDLQAGARVSQDEYDKETAADFALWKAWEEADGPVFWDKYERLGKGRPGWHIECSAMSMIHLGAHFDLHLGGVDLVFPHHQNEIAQSEAYSGEKFVNYWMHVEHLYVESQKMSKSLGNFYTLRNLLNASENQSGKAWDPMAIRFTLLKVPYGSRLNFTFSELAGADASLARLRGFLQRSREQKGEGDASEVQDMIEESRRGFIEAMDDNLNITVALSHVFDLVTKANPLLEKGVSAAAGQALADYLLELDQVLGVQLEPPAEGLDAEQQEWLKLRGEARAARNWAESDRLRDLLLESGIQVEDTSDGVRWKRVKT